ncbi:MAG: type II toxin-antitoxin system VapC family toxin [Dechloromonas sp.]|nr:type II toxin-antitoxin system VapC family toxin [Dechloromonas sp.]
MILLDTHIWIRWLSAPDGLPASLVEQVERADTLAISAISCWELGQLVKRQRVCLNQSLTDWIDLATADLVRVLPIDRQIAQRAAELPEHHRDPADRLIIATAMQAKLPLLSLDGVFPMYVKDGLRLLSCEGK